MDRGIFARTPPSLLDLLNLTFYMQLEGVNTLHYSW